MQKMKNETPFLKKKNSREKVIVFLICALGVAVGQAVPGEDKDNPFAWYGDLRLRYEADFDSEKIDRSEVDDRNRGRIRARVGANYQVNPDVKIGARLRTGDSRSQQSPHLTFVNDQNVDNDDLDFVLDKLFVGYNRVCQAWVGRNSFPFWKQNELFWDDDVALTGTSASFTHETNGSLTATVGAFMLPDGGYDMHGQMGAGQLKYSVGLANDVNFIGAAGLFCMSGDGGSTNLRNGNGDREYTTGAVNFQLKCQLGDVPVSLGTDVYHNFKDYDVTSSDAYAAEHRDQDFGCVYSVVFGELQTHGDWLLGYYYANIGALAVNASYAQDDWFRFGGRNGQTDSSDFRGHELRLAYAIRQDLNLVSRLYIVDRITNPQKGKRFRIDLNWTF